MKTTKIQMFAIQAGSELLLVVVVDEPTCSICDGPNPTIPVHNEAICEDCFDVLSRWSN